MKVITFLAKRRKTVAAFAGAELLWAQAIGASPHAAHMRSPEYPVLPVRVTLPAREDRRARKGSASGREAPPAQPAVTQHVSPIT